MLGEEIVEYHGRIIGQRIIDVEGPKTEVSVLAKGKCKNIDIQVLVTYWSVPLPGQKLYGEGQSVMMTEEGERVTATARGIGEFTPGGNVTSRGSIFYRTNSNLKLSFLNYLFGLFRVEVDRDGNTHEKIWEWK